MATEEANLPEGVKSLRIPEQKIFDGQLFPLILTPKDSHQDHDSAYWHRWTKDNVQILNSLLTKYGAILFRRFPIKDPGVFDEFAKCFGLEEFPYVGGVAVREPIVGNVYTSAESPPEAFISYHHEMAHVADHPKLLFFYCDVPAAEGGETPLALSHIIHRLMSERAPDFVGRLAAEGLRYVRVAPEEDIKSERLGRSWKSTFFAKTKQEVEKNAAEKGFEIEWLANNDMKFTTNVLPAIRYNDRTKRFIWFNSAFLCYQSWIDKRNDRTKSVIFPHGDQMCAEDMEILNGVFEEAGVAFLWEKGDVVMIDNLQVLHARNHFKPPRRILASLFKNPEYNLTVHLPQQT